MKSFTYDFSLAEVQAITAGAMGFDIARQHLADILQPQLTNPNSTLSIVLRRERLWVDAERLLNKLESLPPQKLKAFQETIARVLSMQPSEIFGTGILPSPHVLRAVGLAAPTGAPAWAYCPIVIEGGMYVHEVVLYRDPGNLKAPDTTIEKLAQAAVERVRELRDGASTHPDDFLAALCYGLTLASGERYLRVHEDVEGRVGISPIPVADLRHDLMDGSLRGLVLPGVNAPPPDELHLG